MNDFPIALLWLRSLEIVTGYPPVLMLSELEMPDRFVRDRSPVQGVTSGRHESARTSAMLAQ